MWLELMNILYFRGLVVFVFSENLLRMLFLVVQSALISLKLWPVKVRMLLYMELTKKVKSIAFACEEGLENMKFTEGKNIEE